MSLFIANFWQSTKVLLRAIDSVAELAVALVSKMDGVLASGQRPDKKQMNWQPNGCSIRK